MEQLSSPEELQLMSQMDFIVPLKQVGIITKSVLEAIQEFYQPRRIIVVTKKIEGEILRKLLPYWNVGPVECMDEAFFFVRNFSLTFEDIIAEYDATRPGQRPFLHFHAIKLQKIINSNESILTCDPLPLYIRQPFSDSLFTKTDTLVNLLFNYLYIEISIYQYII